MAQLLSVTWAPYENIDAVVNAIVLACIVAMLHPLADQPRILFDGLNAGTGLPFIPGLFIDMPIAEPIPLPPCPGAYVPLPGVSVLLPIGENDPSPTGCGSVLRSTDGMLLIGAMGLDLPCNPGVDWGGNAYRPPRACMA